MASSADFGCSGGCGSISSNGSPAILFTIVRNGNGIQLQGLSNITLAPSRTYLVEYNAEFNTPLLGRVVSTELRLNGTLVPGSQTSSFPTTMPPGQNTPTASVSGGAIFNTKSTPDPSILQLVGYPPAGTSGTNFNGVNIRVTDITDYGTVSLTGNNAAIYGFGYVDVANNEAVPFLEAEVVNGSGILFSAAAPTVISLAPNATYFAVYNFIECPLLSGLPVRVQFTLNDRTLFQSLSLAPPLVDGNSRSGAAGSAVFNTGPGTNQLKLVNTNLETIKFVAANVNIVQIG
ncbi:hypothetical protein [Paenibacillus agilis]|uniref:Uncharacterized protein n=1 Tax=Paenibacillus agilis TaxID=3020863 RepID=A0A559J2F5_9BACL|nr:hypothetical protein [Paenibacillus agilis]TVX94069.1 hypothetical protein FPZ44_13990 [Paenibacillus agilis]